MTRGAKHVTALILLAGTALATPLAPASAFELFGVRLWGAAEQETDIADPLRYSATLAMTGTDEPLRDDLENASELIAGQDQPVSGSLGLIARARNDRKLLIAALFRNARYGGIVNIAIDGRPLDDIPPDAEFSGEPVPVTISIEPGPVFTLGNVVLDGDAAGLTPARFGLLAGAPAGSGVILKAENDIVRVLKEAGHPLARIEGRKIVADHATSTLDVSLTVAAGATASLGEVSVEGTEQVDREFTRFMTGLESGRPYTPKEMKEAHDRLAGLEVFSSINLREGESLDADGNIPIDLTVSERKFRYFGAGATYSTTEGLGLQGYWGHRNLFGRAEKLRLEGSISGIGDRSQLSKLNYNAAILFEKPGVIGPDSKFFANVKSVYEHPDAYDRFSIRGNSGVQYRLSATQSVSAELAVEWENVKDALNPDGKDYLLVSTPLQYVFDNRNNKLNPTRGFRALATVEPAYDLLNSTSFVKVKTEGAAYRAIDKGGKYVLAGRAMLGSIVGADLADIPADRRFYAGGGGSVRGYAWQGIGPRDSSGRPYGGRSVTEASLEMRINVTETIGVVPFIDAGTVSETEFPDFSDFKLGAGLGVRYFTPFGPLRVDVAVPLNPKPGDPSFGLYAGIGQSF